MIQVVRSDHLVLHTLIVKLDRVVGVVTPEHKEVFDGKLVLLGPSNLESLLLFVGR
jgi:hypothetical protein